MRGRPRTWPTSSSAERRGGATSLRGKNAVVHSRVLRTVHGPSGWGIVGRIVGEGGGARKRWLMLPAREKSLAAVGREGLYRRRRWAVPTLRCSRRRSWVRLLLHLCHADH